MKNIFLISLVLLSSCKFPNFKRAGSGGGSGGGRVPTVDQLQDWLNKSTNNPTRVCDSENTGHHEPSTKYPKIYPYGSKAWTDDYSKIIHDGLSSNEYAPLLNTPLNEYDLDELGCGNFNKMSDEDKKRFWIIFFASMSKAESGFDTTLKYEEGGNLKGTISTGLFQISKNSASNHCSKRINNGTRFDTDDLMNPETNIKCSMHIMMNQILGSPLVNSKTGKVYQSRPGLTGRLLTGSPAANSRVDNLKNKNMNSGINHENVYYWAVLDRGRPGFNKMLAWIKPHLKTQVKACDSNPLIPDDNYKDPKCDDSVSNENRRDGKVCITTPCAEEGTSQSGNSNNQGESQNQ